MYAASVAYAAPTIPWAGISQRFSEKLKMAAAVAAIQLNFVLRERPVAIVTTMKPAKKTLEYARAGIASAAGQYVGFRPSRRTIHGAKRLRPTAAQAAMNI